MLDLRRRIKVTLTARKDYDLSAFNTEIKWSARLDSRGDRTRREAPSRGRPDSQRSALLKGCKSLASLLEVMIRPPLVCGHNEGIGLTTKFQIEEES